jgi:hypothetical protein
MKRIQERLLIGLWIDWRIDNMIYILVGVPGSGKTWISDQLKEHCTVVEQDDYIGQDYIKALRKAHLAYPTTPILANAPFGLSHLMEALGSTCEPVFILEDDDVIRERYYKRGGKEIPKGHLTRQQTYKERAAFLGSFIGTSEAVLSYLKGKVGIK